MRGAAAQAPGVSQRQTNLITTVVTIATSATTAETKLTTALTASNMAGQLKIITQPVRLPTQLQSIRQLPME